MKKTFTQQHKDRISASNKGRIISLEHRSKISNTLKGRTLSRDHINKISMGLLGNKYSVGRIVSEKTRKILSEKGRGRKHSEETLKKMRESTNSGRFKKGRISLMKGKKSIYARELHPMYGTHRSVETRERIANTRKQNQAGNGARNGNWKGGISELKVRIRSSLEYAKKRKEVFMRDWYTCQECDDEAGGNLEMHHKKPFSIIFKENKLKTFEEALLCNELWNIDNCITLCKDCHKGTDSYGRPKKLILINTYG